MFSPPPVALPQHDHGIAFLALPGVETEDRIDPLLQNAPPLHPVNPVSPTHWAVHHVPLPAHFNYIPCQRSPCAFLAHFAPPKWSIAFLLFSGNSKLDSCLPTCSRGTRLSMFCGPAPNLALRLTMPQSYSRTPFREKQKFCPSYVSDRYPQVARAQSTAETMQDVQTHSSRRSSVLQPPQSLARQIRNRPRQRY